MAYFKPLPKPEQDKEQITHLARAVSRIKPYQYIQLALDRMYPCGHVHYYQEMKAWDGLSFRCIVGLYVRRFGQKSDGSEPPVDAVEGDIIEYVPMCPND